MQKLIPSKSSHEEYALKRLSGYEKKATSKLWVANAGTWGLKK